MDHELPRDRPPEHPDVTASQHWLGVSDHDGITADTNDAQDMEDLAPDFSDDAEAPVTPPADTEQHLGAVAVGQPEVAVPEQRADESPRPGKPERTRSTPGLARALRGLGSSATGMSLGEALKLAQSLGVEVRIVGAGADISLTGSRGATPTERVSNAVTEDVGGVKVPRISDEETHRTQRELSQKTDHVKAFLDGDIPTSRQGRAAIENTLTVARNTTELIRQGPLREELMQHLTGRGEPDTFAIQDHSAHVVEAMLRDVREMDTADLVLAVKAFDNSLVEMMATVPDADLDRIRGRVNDLRHAVHMDLVQATSPFRIVGESIAPVRDLYGQMFGQLNDTEESAMRTLQGLVRDRLSVSEMIMAAGLWSARGEHGNSEYSAPPFNDELERLNSRAADTIERLHLLQAYGVTPFEVSGDLLGLPWDVAVVPAIDPRGSTEGVPQLAEGAIADFMLLPKGQEREDLLMHYRAANEGGVSMVSIGNAEAWNRFRLHHNGQISYGLQYHNIPNDNLQRAFSELGAGIAFQRLRGLFIAIAFDAVVPDEVVRGADVRGSVATAIQREPELPLGRRISNLVLRRQKALQRAQVDRNHRTPQGWDGPTRTIGGYRRRLPEGCRPRPTAETEAREYYESRGLAYPGLPEGYTWVGEYERRSNVEVLYQRARFRRGSATSESLRELRRNRRRQ